MNKRIRRALRMIARGMWAGVLWLLASGHPWNKRLKISFWRTLICFIFSCFAAYYGNLYVQIWQLFLFLLAVFAILVCLPMEAEEEEFEYDVRPDEDLDVILTVKYTELGPRGYFDDPFNPAYTHIVDLDKHIAPEDFAA